MEGIQGGEFFLFRQHLPDQKRLKKNKRKKTNFSSILESESQSEMIMELAGGAGELLSEKEIEGLLDDIHSLGERLVKEGSLSIIKEYKQAVKSFIQAVVRLSVKVEERSSGVNVLNRKKFSLLKVVNEKLEKLAAGVLQTQYKQMEILRRLDEIHGLLVDLLH